MLVDFMVVSFQWRLATCPHPRTLYKGRVFNSIDLLNVKLTHQWFFPAVTISHIKFDGNLLWMSFGESVEFHLLQFPLIDSEDLSLVLVHVDYWKVETKLLEVFVISLSIRMISFLMDL